jgi:hypothetical protein
MIKRSIVGMIILNLIFPLIYHYYWLIKTKHEMAAKGVDIPTSLLAFIPFVNYYWQWKWSVGVEHVTRGKMSAGVSFLLTVLLGYIVGPAIIQATFNELPDERVSLPQARVA